MKVLIFLCTIFVVSNGFILELLNKITGNKNLCSDSASFKDPAKARDPVCEAKADTGDCSFYDCFEERYPCRQCGFPKTYELYNCEKMKLPLYSDKFNPAGQKFLVDAGKCLTTFMKSLYQMERLSCEVIKHQMEEKVSECFISSGFCDVLMDNRNALWSVYNVKKIMTNVKVVGEIMDVAKNCSEQIASWAFGQAHSGITQSQNNINTGLSQIINAFGKK